MGLIPNNTLQPTSSPRGSRSIGWARVGVAAAERGRYVY